MVVYIGHIFDSIINIKWIIVVLIIVFSDITNIIVATNIYIHLLDTSIIL
jgi:hypothetical protein